MMLQESTTTDTLPLAGIRVLEFCHTIMGPSAGLILADLGADVIKIEPANGDPTRRRRSRKFCTGHDGAPWLRLR
jgi:crotonobetainyl-CoA:carnitine CoA-transferase CaiB-like acyl-CoA transferase